MKYYIKDKSEKFLFSEAGIGLPVHPQAGDIIDAWGTAVKVISVRIHLATEGWECHLVAESPDKV